MAALYWFCALTILVVAKGQSQYPLCHHLTYELYAPHAGEPVDCDFMVDGRCTFGNQCSYRCTGLNTWTLDENSSTIECWEQAAAQRCHGEASYLDEMNERGVHWCMGDEYNQNVYCVTYDFCTYNCTNEDGWQLEQCDKPPQPTCRCFNEEMKTNGGVMYCTATPQMPSYDDYRCYTYDDCEYRCVAENEWRLIGDFGNQSCANNVMIESAPSTCTLFSQEMINRGVEGCHGTNEIPPVNYVGDQCQVLAWDGDIQCKYECLGNNQWQEATTGCNVTVPPPQPPPTLVCEGYSDAMISIGVNRCSDNDVAKTEKPAGTVCVTVDQCGYECVGENQWILRECKGDLVCEGYSDEMNQYGGFVCSGEVDENVFGFGGMCYTIAEESPFCEYECQGNNVWHLMPWSDATCFQEA